MARSNVANHSLRLNLDNEQHRRVEKVLANLNLDVHKSINQFLVEAVDVYIRKLEGNDLVYEDIQKQEKSPYMTRKDMDELGKEIKDELQKEMIGTLVSYLVNAKVTPMPEIRTIREVPVQNITEDAGADETTIGLASSWG